MPIAKLKAFLDSHNVKYEIISHSTAYTAQETAASSRIPGEELAKTVIVKVDDTLAMAVLPASRHVDLSALQKATGAKALRLANEIEFKDRFPDCEVGAMPPFGNLYGVAVFAEESLAKSSQIAFNACSHEELIRISYEDFETLVRPTVLRFASEKGRPRAAGLEDRQW